MTDAMASWRKARASNEGASCVEVHGSLTLIRDSKNLDGPVLPAPAFTALTTLVKADAFTSRTS